MYFLVFAINLGYLVGITIPLPSSIFFLLLIVIGAAFTGYHYNHRTNGLPSAVSESMIQFPLHSPAFIHVKNRNA